MSSTSYFDSTGAAIYLGQQLGKGGSATVYLHGSDRSKAVKIFNQEYLAAEGSLVRRLRELQKLSNVAHLELDFEYSHFAIGSWPRELVMERSGMVVGFTMNTINDGIDLTEIIFARDRQNAFFQYSPGKKRHKSVEHYKQWLNTFLYCREGLRNRFILCYNLSVAFHRIYNLRQRDGRPIDLQLCNFDIKPNNILVALIKSRSSFQILPYILDLDNLTLINKTGRLSPQNPQHTPEYSAPEGPVDHYYDYYSIAVIFYQLIFNIHPFEGVQGVSRFTDGSDREFFLKNKCFPWGKNKNYLKHVAQHDNFSYLPDQIQKLFLSAFDCDSPSQRPGMRAWSTAFLQLLSDRAVCFEKLFRF
jgi:DNA-binding helix-hairpin-helix protein with protein kinase domain